MDRDQARQIAEAIAIGRIAIGIVALVAPTVPLRPWVGRDFAWQPRAKLLARSLGARDLALGAGGLVALRDGDRERARRWFAAQGVTDAVDLVATVAARDVPLPARLFAGLVAAGSAAIAAAYVLSNRQP
jgi:hypothetical protein